MSEHLTDDARRRRAHATVDRVMSTLLAKDMAGFAGLWAPTGIMEFPFAPPGRPRRLDGADAVWEYVRDYTDHIDLRAITSETRHETQNPDVLVVEFSVEGLAVRTGRPYRMSYVAVIEVGAEGIVSYRDYWNPLAVAEALGADSELVAGSANAAAHQEARA
ncbi:Ketosteroid isomerase-related protein [Streptoalloteichus tenebrarius]|uniref:Ketosteroid isomerase-related protein n=1 Tax=Streptoalloteichus tenebrarius (strain ATCC 17920 / DSM 40477 / JCM 4838 / CBS 697.72 / NBRC 16177 / NCIMB 11028 / NRRL B-12390 / A12253. 1 / ISP 5477) TaxID=1933 RepID=A0ABT1HWU2_STRSD|nr:nuclear transport factor 2 family protein [Streptoalloteichus tenebrarius]MCP2259998.1 Ketosteroid isomerase-related protein [Streptoalloteichus tenebrarius]BFF03889.1 nuclear transport factor 2 family protein [Streptoalloteichus tenebrarius]